jgi:hypothetical protein
MNREARSILYSQNVFVITEPEQLLRLAAQIGPGNFKQIRALNICVACTAEILPWLRLLSLLAEEASGLRGIELAWAMCLERADRRGLGDNVNFVRALGKIQGLKTLAIKGYYAKHWPTYLEERMGVRVQARRGNYLEERDFREKDLNNKELELESIIREKNIRELRVFREFQQGTEDLFP